MASASTWTVDDDGAQCPDASFTSIQAAVDQAAPHDTIVVCAGLYRESSTPANSVYSPVATGAHNGLTISKPLTIRGAGASKVTIEPATGPLGSAATLAGTTPDLRDGGGNVISIVRQSLGSTDADENRVDISGVTVRSPDVWAEAGVAFFNTSGSVTDSVVGPFRQATSKSLATTHPYGYGVVETNSLIGAQGGPRREVTVKDSLVTGYQAGGIRFDDSTDALPNTRSGIIAYGDVDGTRVQGQGTNAFFGQVGVEYHAGQRGSVTGSEIVGNAAAPGTTPPTSAGILLTDAQTTADPDVPGAFGFLATGNTITGNAWGLYNADIANTAVRVGAPASATGNFWGCPTGPTVGAPSTGGCDGVSGNDTGGAASVTAFPFANTAPTALTVPGATADAAPTVAIEQPTDGTTVAVGADTHPIVVAADDFGIASVALSADGVPVATLAHAPYEYSWVPTADEAGRDVTLQATATDSSGQTTTSSVVVHVPAAIVATPTPSDGTTTTPPDGTTTTAPNGTPPATGTTAPATPTSGAVKLSGTARVGRTLTCSPGTWTPTPTGYAYQWYRGSTAIESATKATYRLVTEDTASTVSCRVTVTTSAGTATGASSSVLVTLPTTRTSASIIEQAGPAILRLHRTVKTGSKLRAGTVTCERAASKTCGVAITGHLTVHGKTYKLAAVGKVKRGHSSAVSFRTTARIRRLLASGKAHIALKAVVVDDTGFHGSAKASLLAGKR